MNFNNLLNGLRNYDWKSYLTASKIVYHFALGFVSCLLGAGLWGVLFAHLAWELFTNWEQGQQITQQYLGRNFSDHDWQTSVADNILFAIGWLLANYSCGNGNISVLTKLVTKK